MHVCDSHTRISDVVMVVGGDAVVGNGNQGCNGGLSDGAIGAVGGLGSGVGGCAWWVGR